MRPRPGAAWAAMLICAVIASRAAALDIIPTFVDDNGQTWDATKQAVINQAIGDWERRLQDPQTINVTFHFQSAGSDGYLGQWSDMYSLPDGTNIRPWTPGVAHVVDYNVDFMDPSLPNQLVFTTGKVPFSDWDALSITRHELGHMLGFTDGTYYNNYHTVDQIDQWASHIVGTTFDPGTLNVQMDAPNNLSHVSDSGATANDLMTPALFNGDRRIMSTTDLKMLESAYHYEMIPGDATLDGKVDFSDLVALAAHYGNTTATWEEGDFNHDGVVNFADLVTLAANYGQTLDTYSFGSPAGAVMPAIAPVPEPGVAGIVALAALGLTRRRRGGNLIIYVS